MLILPGGSLFAQAPKTGKKAAEKPAKAVVASANTRRAPRLSETDPDAKVGLQALYALEYDKALDSFQKTLERRPEDPAAINYVLQAVVLKELFRLNALDTTLYADNGFLTGEPLPGDPVVKQQIVALAERAIALCDARLRKSATDVDALYARGVSRGLRLSYTALVEKSFWSALRTASASRNDHEKVLQLDPGYTNAKLVVGIHNYIAGSLPFAARIMAGIVGMSGDKKKGLAYLAEVAAANVETSVDARVALALFLRREGRYPEALAVMQQLTALYPRNFIFALEQGNLMKDAGLGAAAVQQFAAVVNNGLAGFYPAMHIERAYFGWAESLKGQRQPAEALAAYTRALQVEAIPGDLRLRALLGAGQMLDVLDRREAALLRYREVITADPDSPQAAAARAYMKKPYRYPR